MVTSFELPNKNPPKRYMQFQWLTNLPHPPKQHQETRELSR